MLDTLERWTLKDPLTSQRGAKSCPITLDDGSAVIVQLGSKHVPITSPFGATSYGDDSCARMTIEFSLESDRTRDWDAVAEWLRGYLHENAERLLKKQLSPDTIRDNLRTPAVQKGDYRPLLRTKITTTGAHAVRCWDEKGQKIALPEDLRGVPVIARLHVDRLWIMSKEYGLVLVVTDLKILDHCAVGSSCPFEN